MRPAFTFKRLRLTYLYFLFHFLRCCDAVLDATRLSMDAHLAEGCSSLTNRNLPPSFWNSNYIHPVPAPSHPQVSIEYLNVNVCVHCV